jgi:hypothetical protein
VEKTRALENRARSQLDFPPAEKVQNLHYPPKFEVEVRHRHGHIAKKG